MVRRRLRLIVVVVTLRSVRGSIIRLLLVVLRVLAVSRQYSNNLPDNI